jgi:hypothetical protein
LPVSSAEAGMVEAKVGVLCIGFVDRVDAGNGSEGT